MADKQSEFLRRLHATFSVEAREHLAAMFAGLTALERTSDEARQAELVETIFREAHSLKGASGAVGLTQVERACQSIESTFAAMKRKELVLVPELFDDLHRALDHVGILLAGDILTDQGGKPVEPSHPEAGELTAAPREPFKAHQLLPDEKKPVTGTVRITTEKLDSIFLKAEEMLAAKLFAQHRKQELQRLNVQVAAWGKSWANLKVRHPEFYKVAVNRPQWFELLEENTTFIKALMQDLAAISKAADQDQRMLGRMTNELLDGIKTALLLPCSMLLEIFPKVVRDLAKEQGKEIDLVIHGGELEMDRRILDEIKDPLIHLIRNCVDHGIEQPAVRTKKHKQARGKIEITVFPHSGDRVEIRISDDGAGIDIDKVQQAAKRLGFADQDELSELDEQGAMEFIFQSGVSTSPIVTELSGRGLGLAIVREKVQKLGGTISIESRPNEGASFCMLLPNTLANYRGILVRVGEQQFILPTRNVERSLRVRNSAVQTVENLETVGIDGVTFSLARLSDVLGITTVNTDDADFLQILVLSTNGKKIAFCVDEILNEQEVLVKGLGKQLARVRNIEAATILGSGKVVPILNVADLMKSALQRPGRSRRQAAAIKEMAQQEKSILVVEDSITARSLLKGVLEMAGYKVTTAVDGVEGLTRLRSEIFDLVVSDVEMPRMNGFDLTTRIRSDKKLEELPVVLVTALESREDRERGIEVGANAYIVKRSFEQSNLLEVIQRLV